jgi:translation initiation factor IF-2
MRVFDLAQSLNTTSTEVLGQAERLGFEAHTPLSRLEADEVRQLQAHFTQRTPADIERDAAARKLQLEAKQQAARARRAELDAGERALLEAAVQRARECEARIKGLAAPAKAKADVAAAPVAPTVIIAAAPAVQPPFVVLVPTPEAPAAAGETAKSAAAVTPATADTEAEAAAKAAKPGKPGVKSVHFNVDDAIDPDEVLEATYTGRKVTRPVVRPADKPRVGRDREPERRLPAPAPHVAPIAHPLHRRVAAQPQPAAPAPTAPERIITVRGAPVVKDLAELLGLRPNRVIADLMQLNVLASINQRVELETATRIAGKYGFKIEIEKPRRSNERKPVMRRDDADDDIADDQNDSLVPRPPVVTFLGHVDHGKTSLMDRIRNAQVAAGESGGITQHIGAYSVDVNGRRITFLDTPGHAAFSAMRARGANLTDIAVIIIAADDGVMPQTKEVIKQAKQANVQIVVAINKCDLPSAKPERVRQQLQAEGLTPEEWGGDIVCCEVSAATGKGVDHLLEMLLLQADVLELTANPGRRADGFVVEAELEQGRGPTATLLVSGGTLNIGDVVLCGEHLGRVRALVDERGRMVKSAGPAMAVKCMGLSGVPEAGAPFRVMLNEKRARELAEKYAEERKQTELFTSKATSLDALMSQFKAQDKLELQVIVKADTQGSCEAIVESLKDIRSTKVGLNIINSGIGNITPNDIQRAAAGGAAIIGFHVGCEPGVQSQARHEGVLINTFRIIYELIDHLKLEMLALLSPEYRETIRGHAQIRAIFGVGKKGRVAGCVVTDGVVRMDARVRVYRVKEKLFEGKLMSLYHFQNEVSEVKEPQECGMRFHDFEAFAEGDTVECFSLEELERTL